MQPQEPPAIAVAATQAEKQTGLTSEGQRRINLIWECTQAAVALLVVAANIAVWLRASFSGQASPVLRESLIDGFNMRYPIGYVLDSRERSRRSGHRFSFLCRLLLG